MTHSFQTPGTSFDEILDLTAVFFVQPKIRIAFHLLLSMSQIKKKKSIPNPATGKKNCGREISRSL